ncbi:BrnA antitoxin family protein [Rhizobium sp. LjRoot98]|uniref:BrnA antitoxin family protein n=1 Tax=unclassified Rhizobium TaxID=2613769 RepID=UPI0007139387|nr:BrnA antitoxin family protein [Rhizobium sp. Root1204]KQV35279.1 hypothetical protein ASC96_29430 [Rhizobium sp. Root1204]
MAASRKARKLPHDKVQEVLDYQATKDRRRSYPSRNQKGLLSVRIDQDVIDYFKGTGEGWQSRINSVLRQASGIDDVSFTANDYSDF